MDVCTTVGWYCGVGWGRGKLDAGLNYVVGFWGWVCTYVGRGWDGAEHLEGTLKVLGVCLWEVSIAIGDLCFLKTCGELTTFRNEAWW